MIVDGKKRCPRCDALKAPEDFGISRAASDGLQSYCKSCQKGWRAEAAADGRHDPRAIDRRSYEKHREKRVASTAARMRRNKRALVDERGGACECCGYSRSYAALQFHHRNPADKSFEIGTRLSMSLDRLREEAEKCDLLCANCHAEEHEMDLAVAA